MSIKMISAIWDNAPQVEGNALLILLALADMANDSGVCWPSYATLAKRARISRRSAMVIMQKLSEAGYISKTGRAAGKEQKSNLFYVNLSAIIAGGSEVDSLPSEPIDSLPSESRLTTPSESATALPSESATAPEPSINRQSETSMNPHIAGGRFEIPPMDEIDGKIKELSDRFTNLTGIFPRDNDRWVKSLREMLIAKITPQDLENTFAVMRKKKLSISGPWSLVNMSISLKSEGGANNIDIGKINV